MCWENLSRNGLSHSKTLSSFCLSSFILCPYGANLSELSSAAWRDVQLFNEGWESGGIPDVRGPDRRAAERTARCSREQLQSIVLCEPWPWPLRELRLILGISGVQLCGLSLSTSWSRFPLFRGSVELGFSQGSSVAITAPLMHC